MARAPTSRGDDQQPAVAVEVTEPGHQRHAHRRRQQVDRADPVQLRRGGLVLRKDPGQQRVGRKMNGVDAPVPVGHSYGGAVISNAATGAKNVRALVKAALDHS
jgi:hypothetical protein